MLRRGFATVIPVVSRRYVRQNVKFSRFLLSNPYNLSFTFPSTFRLFSTSEDDTSRPVVEIGPATPLEAKLAETASSSSDATEDLLDLEDKTPQNLMDEYTGERNEAGQRHGYGTRVWDSKDGAKNLYEGEWKEDAAYGKGKYFINNKLHYEGDFEASKFHGEGTLYIKNAVYNGQMFDSHMHGKGKLTYDTGSIFIGEFARGKKIGQCHIKYADGDEYEGGIDNDQMVGRGVFKFANGDVYDGEYAGGKMNGRGVYSFVGGDKYFGEFVNDEFHGRGQFERSNGDVYHGFYVMSRKEGRGKMEYANGEVYDGDWSMDKYDGEGFFKYADGRVEQVFHRDGERVAEYSESLTKHGEPKPKVEMPSDKPVEDRFSKPPGSKSSDDSKVIKM